MNKTSVFTASRLTAGNFMFPVRIEVSLERVAQIRPSFVGSEEECIAISKVQPDRTLSAGNLQGRLTS